MLASAHRPKVLTSIVLGLTGGIVSNTLIMASVADATYYGRYFSRVNGLIFIIASLLIANTIREVTSRRSRYTSSQVGGR